MGYVPFYKDESGFASWVKFHRFGIVINSSPGRLEKKYIVAHRATCQSFERGIKTTYSKHCFDSLNEALEFLKGHGLPKPSFGCTHCKVSALEPSTDPNELEDRVETLLAERQNLAPVGNREPQRVTTGSATLIQRDPAVCAWVLANANGKCEQCAADAPFQNSRGRPYLEVHHVKTLANGGPDTIDNSVALCPNCHRAMHHSQHKSALQEKIYGSVTRLVR